MKKIFLFGLIVLIASLLLVVSSCDTELGHSGEDHDHDGDGVQDHAPEDHVDENEHGSLEKHDNEDQ